MFGELENENGSVYEYYSNEMADGARKILIGKDQSCDVHINEKNISKI